MVDTFSSIRERGFVRLHMESVIYYVRNGVEKTATIRTRRVPNILSVKFAIISRELSGESPPSSLKGATTLNEMMDRLAIVITDVRPRLHLQKLSSRQVVLASDEPPNNRRND